MRVKLQRQKKLSLPDKLQSVYEIKEALTFLHPELNDDEVNSKLIFLLATIASSEHLQTLWNSTNKVANEKVDEVTDLYCNFFSETTTDNNN
jgi:hypothetical protein